MPLETKLKASKLAKRILAVHEAGHAVLGWNEPLMSTVKKVRIWAKQRRGDTIFKTRYTSPCDEDDYLADIAVDLAGSVAEKIVFGKWSNVNGDDLNHARAQIEEMICEHGMSKIGPLHLLGRPMSAVMRHRVEAETQKTLEERLRDPKLRKQLDLVTEALLDRKKLKKRDLKELLGKRPKAKKLRAKTNARRKK